MVPIPSPSDDSLDTLRSQLRMMEERLTAVERRLDIAPAAWVPTEGGTETPAPAATPWDNAGGLATLLGKSLLGLALAYLLRGFAESGSIPVPLGVGVGIVYALLWLVWASRTPSSDTVTVGLRALTGVLVVLPLVWEATIRFGALSSWAAATILAVFSILGLVISWQKNLTSVAWITSLGGLAAIGALMVRTHDLLPYTAALLALALAVEVSACLTHYLGERWIVALFADAAILLLTFVATRPAGLATGYVTLQMPAVLAAQIALVLIYFSSTIVRTLLRGFGITSFEIAQSAAAVAVAGAGAIRVSSGHPEAALTVGVFCALCGIACYVVSMSFLDHGDERDRNFRTYATFGLLLVLAGSYLLLSRLPLIGVWSTLAVMLVVIGRRAGRSTLKAHAAAYLLLASFVSGAAGATASWFLGTSGHLAGAHLDLGLVAVALGAPLCYWLLVRGAAGARSTGYLLSTTVVSATGAWMALGLAASLLGPVCRSMSAESAPDLCPTLLTGLLVAASLGLSLAARRFALPELRWLSILLIVVASGKLLLQDLRQSHAFALVLSLAVYGVALILLPRLAVRSSETVGVNT